MGLMPSTATIKDVELVSVGTWAAATGVTKVTRADLEAMLAAHADGLVDHAPVKLGHASPLNDGIGDGAPAYGWVVPTRIGTNSAGADTLIGDLVGMPAQLAAVAPTAYRRRSVEIAWQVKTPQGKTYAAALVGVALLGATAPAVKGLADVFALYSEQPTEERRDVVELVAGLEGQAGAVAMLAHLRAAGATVTELDELAARAGARDTVDLPPPVDVPDNDDPTDHQPHTRTQEGRTMPQITEAQLRQLLNVEQDADLDAAVAAALEARTAAPAAVTVPPSAVAPVVPAPTGEPETPTAGGAPATTVAPTAAATQGELVSLSAGAWAEAQRDIVWARDERRRQLLDGAIQSGRIAPAERTHFAAQLERDEEGTTTLISGLAPRFAVSNLGAEEAPNAQAGEAAFDAFEAQTFPGLNRPASA